MSPAAVVPTGVGALRTHWVLVLATLTATQTAWGTAPQNDAGLGGDASDERTTATPLPAYGAYAGELRSLDDDWYALPRAPGPACVQLDASGDTRADATLALRTTAGERSVRAPLVEGLATRLALAGNGADLAWVGIESAGNPTGHDAARPRHYAFALQETAAGLGADAGTGADAGATPAQATPVEGGCVAGALRPLAGLGDARDTYAFHVPAGGQVAYSFAAPSGVTLQLLDAAGAPVAAPLAGDGMATFVAPEASTYYLQASAGSGTGTLAYVIGLIGPDPPPGNPCRPHCAVA